MRYVVCGADGWDGLARIWESYYHGINDFLSLLLDLGWMYFANGLHIHGSFDTTYGLGRKRSRTLEAVMG